MKILLRNLIIIIVFAFCGTIVINAQTTVELRYELAEDQSEVFVQGGGYAYSIVETFSEMEVNNYSVPHATAAVWPSDENSYDAATKEVQRNKILGGTWPGGDSMSLTRFIQYGITAKEGTTLDVNKISLYAGIAGTSALRFMVYYSIDDFTTSTLLLDHSSSITAYNMYRGLAEPSDIHLEAGESLKVRIYPWWSGTSDKTGAYLCVGEFNIQGVASSSSLSVLQPTPDEFIAFEGAEGGGRKTTGGNKNGVVYFVNTLVDNSIGNSTTREGSLRWCLNRSGNKIIFFKVAGIIHLESRLYVRDNTTIAGQTAPGDGICIADNTVQVIGDNVIIRYLRFRLGDVSEIENDALWGRNCTNVIIDHCSMSWSIDECASFYDNTNFTMQWCVLSESLRNSYNAEGSHGYGGIWGGKNATYHHNLLAHHDGRNPRFSGSMFSNEPELELVDFRNNVIYNWGNICGYGGEGGSFNLVNNYYKPTIYSKNPTRFLAPNADGGTNNQAAGVWGEFYINGNYMSGSSSVTNDNWLGVYINGTATESQIKSDFEFESPYVTTETAQDGYNSVLDFVGASFKRDSTDIRVVNEVRNGLAPLRASNGTPKGGLIDSQEDVGGWDTYSYNSNEVLLDTDNDGMPDVWELGKGLSITDDTDANNYNFSRIYSNIELYMNGIINGGADLLVTPNSCDLGDAQPGEILTKELTITGFDIEPASGTFTLSVDNGFLIAVDETDVFTSSITMDYIGDNLEFSTFYISITEPVGGLKEGTLTVSNGTINKEIPLRSSFGVPVELRYELAEDESYEFIEGNGEAYAVTETFSEMEVNNYSVPHATAAVWPSDENNYDAATKEVQRNKILGGTWPGGDAMSLTRYVEYGITAKESTSLDINKISLYAGIAGSSALRFMAYYSTDNFVTSTLVSDYSSSVTAYNMYRCLSEPTDITLEVGESLKVRVYPWWTGSLDKTGAYLCLAEVNFQGMSFSTTNTLAKLSTKTMLENTVKWMVSDGFVRIKNLPTDSELAIFTFSGKLIHKSKSSSKGDEDLMSLKIAKGVYIGVVQSQEGKQTFKFVVQ